MQLRKMSLQMRHSALAPSQRAHNLPAAAPDHLRRFAHIFHHQTWQHTQPGHRNMHHPQQQQPAKASVLCFNSSSSLSEAATHIKVLSIVNESTKWTVSAAVAGVLLWLHNAHAAWCVLGAIASSFLCKVLKYLINQQRPHKAQKADPGMPSSHANSLNFLSVYAALSLKHHVSNDPAALAVFTIALGAFLTWLRVALGFHTWPQVLVGAALGSLTAATWFFWGVQQVLPSLNGSDTATSALYVAVAVAVVAFAVKNVLSWWEEQRQMQHQRV